AALSDKLTEDVAKFRILRCWHAKLSGQRLRLEGTIVLLRDSGENNRFGIGHVVYVEVESSTGAAPSRRPLKSRRASGGLKGVQAVLAPRSSSMSRTNV